MKKDTVLILGAGVSAEYGYPSGQKLLSMIKEILAQTNKNHIVEAIVALNPTSIDYFLSIRPEYSETIKPIILNILLKVEENHATFIRHDEKGNEIDTIYKLLFRTIEESDYSAVRIITFNYDRSLEAYFTKAIAAKHKISLQDAFQKVGAIQIEHVYGRLPSLGSFETNHSLSTKEPLLYGEFSSYKNLYSNWEQILYSYANDNIYTVYENSENMRGQSGVRFNRIREHILWGQRILFLGFSYHKLNMRLLGFNNLRIEKQEFTPRESTYWNNLGVKSIVGTCFNMGRVEQKRITSSYPIKKLIKAKNVEFFDDFICLENPEWDVQDVK